MSNQVDEYTGVNKNVMWWLRRVVPVVAVALVILSVFALKQYKQKDRPDIPPARSYSALQVGGFLFYIPLSFEFTPLEVNRERSSCKNHTLHAYI